METKKTKTKTKKLSIFGYEIISNQCIALRYNLYLKKFGEWVKHSGMEHGFELSMNHIKIHELLNEAISVEVKREEGTRKVFLIIETEDYKISIEIPQKEN